ncbi:hypothetical protein QQ045_019895 [Rhodiola kirilowii]
MASSYMSQFQMTGTNLFSTYASLTGTLMLLRSMFNDFIPIPLRNYLIETFRKIFKKTSPDHMTLVVDERTGYNKNHVYEAAETYLRTIINPTVDRLKVSKTPRQNKLTISIEKNQTILDTYEGIKITWKYVFVPASKESGSNKDKYYFEIVFEKKFKETVLGSYLPYVMSRFDQIKKEDKVVRLYTRGGDVDDDDENARGEWGSVRLEHPVTFDKLAMDPEQKKMIIDDLDRFVSRKEYYQRIGKVWKRGYLLYGPPGTGKSSLIAAMANYLKFDIYDLELSSIHSDSYLRSILMSTTNRSILIIEDIDCNVEAQDRALEVDQSDSKLTLSGLLNFIDGLWSSCGDERIIVFTTNHKEKLDPALLRPGRMDVHIHMSYCTPAGFKILASNYLDLKDTHPLFEEIERLMISAKVTPAEVAEELMRSEDPEVALDGVLNLLKRKEEQGQTKEKESQVEKVPEIPKREIMKKFKEMVLGSYLPYVMSRFDQIKKEDKVVRLYTRGGDVDDDDENARGGWGSVRLEHPVTFDKLAMDPEQKKMIIDDMDRFVSRKEFYQRIGKVWKRGYLLYGPPGTGKSSLIAAMANYLKLDIYDLELSTIYSDSYLRSILMSTTNRSILIIEDIDCNVEAQDRALELTLSGLLNFIDGLWSSCGDERIIIFTTNHKEKLDPALLRPGRMDVHIHMSYCTPAGFKILASNYLDLKDTHPLFEEIERLMISAKVTPAEVAEELMRSEDPEVALDGVLNLLKRKIAEEEQGQTKEKESQVEKVPAISKRETMKVAKKNTKKKQGTRKNMKKSN